MKNSYYILNIKEFSLNYYCSGKLNKTFRYLHKKNIITDAEKSNLKKQIKLLIEKMQVDIISLEKMTQPVKPENSLGRISRMDAINNKSVMEVSLRNKRDKLTKLRISLSNIDNDNFGHCKMCKNLIHPKRLIYMPESNRCVRCADR